MTPETPRLPKTPFRVFLVRHGYSELNANNNIHIPGVTDETAQLHDPIGFDQAEASSRFLAQFLIDHPLEGGISLYNSSYMRARQTAQRFYNNLQGLAGYPPLRPHESDLLIEQQHGYLDGLTDEEIDQLFPYHRAREDRHFKEGAKVFAPKLGGEPRNYVELRAKVFQGEMFREIEHHGARTIVIVSHGITTRMISKALLKQSWEGANDEPNPLNCDIRLLQRFGDNYEKFGDFGYIWHGGQPQAPHYVAHERVADRLARGEFQKYKPRPTFAAPDVA